MALEFGNSKHIGFKQESMFEFLIDSAGDLERDAIDGEQKQLKSLISKMKRGDILSGPEQKTYDKLNRKFIEMVAEAFGNRATTYRQIAEHFGVHVQTVKNWVKKDMPRHSRGNYDLLAIRKWALDQGYLHEESPGDDHKAPDSEENYSQEYKRERYLNEKAKREERGLKVKELLGMLISVEEVSREFKEMSRSIKKEFSSLPQKIAPFLEGLNATQIQAKLTEAITDGFRHLNKR